MYITTRNSRLMGRVLNKANEKLKELNESIDYFAINYTDTNMSHSLTPPPRYRKLIEKYINKRGMFIHLDFVAKTWFCIKYILEKTNFDWFWRGTEDIFINWEKLDGYVRYLARTYNPRTDPIVLGHCIPKLPDQKSAWIQGGSGMLISRKAAELLEPWLEWALQYTPSGSGVPRR